MTIWKKGMLAVCVDDSDSAYGRKSINKGQIYKVLAVGAICPNPSFGYGHGLFLEGVKSKSIMGFSEHRFRPAVLDNKAADEKFTAMIKGKIKA